LETAFDLGVQTLPSYLVLSPSLYPYYQSKNILKIAISSFGKLMKLEEIQKILAKHKKELYEKYKIEKMGIFGSFVRGEEREESDIDILVEFEDVPGLIKFIEVEEYLSKLLGRKVDLVRKPAIRKELRPKILKEVVYV